MRWWTRSWPTPPWTESTGLSASSPSSPRPPITHSFRWRSWLLSLYIIRTISISDNNDNLAFSRLHCRPRPRPPPPGQRWQMQEPRSFGGKALVCWKSTICWHQLFVENQKYLRWPNYVSNVCLRIDSPLCLLFLDDHTCVGDKKQYIWCLQTLSTGDIVITKVFFPEGQAPGSQVERNLFTKWCYVFFLQEATPQNSPKKKI